MEDSNTDWWSEAFDEMVESGELNVIPVRPNGRSGIYGFKNNFPNVPKNAFIMGMADDGLPVLLNVSDPEPGGMLFISDSKKDRDDFLRTCLAMNDGRHEMGLLCFKTEDWKAFGLPDTNLHSYYSRSASDFILAVSGYSYSRGSKPFIFMMEDFTTKEFEYGDYENLSNLILTGANRKIFCIATTSWEEYIKYNHFKNFRTIFLGKDNNGRSEEFSDILKDLNEGEFFLQEKTRRTNRLVKCYFPYFS